MYAIRSYYVSGYMDPDIICLTVTVFREGIIGSGIRVITSYSIHYTKLYDYLLLSAFGLCLSTHGNAQIAMFGNNPQHTGVYHSDLPNDLELVKKWKFKTNGMIFSSPVVSNGSIYFGSDDSCLYALDTLGHNKWIFKCDGILRSAPAVMDTLVYINIV